jgi:SAM-dependent methyltransferase
MDVFGAAFRDFQAGEIGETINVVIDQVRQEELPVSYFFRTYGQMPEWEKLVLDRCRGRILDVGAGAGAHSLVLQERGHQVTAIDLSPGAVAAMKRAGVLDARCVDFFSFVGETFDVVLFLMNGIGLAGSLDGLVKALRHAGNLLKPGGEIFLESTDLMYMFEQEDGSYLIPAGHRYYGEVAYQLTYKNVKARPFAWLFTDPDNLAHCAEQAGLKTDIIWQGEDHNFVARLVKRAE